MQINKLTSAHGPQTVVTLTDFEKRVFIAMVRQASLPKISGDIDRHKGDYAVDQRVGHVLQMFLKAVK